MAAVKKQLLPACRIFSVRPEVDTSGVFQFKGR
jgi:hypothetical protein